jgi:hypothetical protein
MPNEHPLFNGAIESGSQEVQTLIFRASFAFKLLAERSSDPDEQYKFNQIARKLSSLDDSVLINIERSLRDKTSAGKKVLELLDISQDVIDKRQEDWSNIALTVDALNMHSTNIHIKPFRFLRKI